MNQSINEIIKTLEIGEGFSRYIAKVELNRKKSTTIKIESGGGIFSYSKAQAVGIGNKYAKFSLVDLLEIRLGHKTQVNIQK